MRYGVVAFALLAGGIGASALAQESEAPVAIPPLVARYAGADGRLLIGGVPEAEQVAATVNGLQARPTGSAGAVPLLAQGVILLAILPSALTPNDIAPSKRFAGGAPVAVPLMLGLQAYARRDATGAIDGRAKQALAGLLEDAGQAALASRLPSYKSLDALALAAAREKLAAIPTTRIPDVAPGYRAADGRIAIIGSDSLAMLFPDLVRAYARVDPRTRFATDLRGSSIAMPALTAGTSALAPMGREPWENDLDGFRQVKGYAPTRIRIAYASHGPRPDGKSPPAFYVHATNPIAGLSMPQIRRIFAAGAPGGDIVNWASTGGTGPWRDAPIHVFGARDDGAFGTAMRLSKLDGLPFSARYRAATSGKAILEAVAADPFAIGYATWMDAGGAPAGVKMLPLAGDGGGPFVLPGKGPQRGRWPISYFFNIYVDKALGRPVAPEVKNLLRFILSDEGQKIVAAHDREENGYLPLDPRDLAAERLKVSGL